MGPMTIVEDDASQKYRSIMLNNLVDSFSVFVGDSTICCTRRQEMSSGEEEDRQDIL